MAYDAQYWDRRLNDPEAIAHEPDPGAPNTLVYKPNMREQEIFSDQRALTCGSCLAFRPDHLRPHLKSFLQVLVHEHEWRTRHLGEDPRVMGICGQRDDTLVGPNTRACEHHRDRRGATIIPIDAVRRKRR